MVEAGRSGHPPQRRDIQGLRALAVGLVLIYHLRPGRLPGGFVGVDVFFVISGFLIIGTLTSELRRTGRLGLLNFYARRIRRLLPAASVVLLATVGATLALVPMSRWPSILREVVFSALNAQNWLLALFSSDYVQATAGASPVQHFWSLSVEEQFYLIIPLILLITAVVAAKAGRRIIPAAFGSVLVITIASLVFSALFTPGHHESAYFVTPTRMWELGLGGLTAMVIHRLRPGPVLRLLLGWGGLAAVLAGAFLLTTEMAFPGWIALLPTLGTVGLLVAGSLRDGERARRGEVSPLLGLQPLHYIGDISYSLYLWHWPVIVFLLEATGSERLSAVQVLLAGAVSLVLASITKHAVEDPFRRKRRVVDTGQPPSSPTRIKLVSPRRRTAYLLGASLIVVTVAAATVPWQVAQARLDDLATNTALDADHPGALAMDPAHPVPVTTGVPLLPDPAVADKDIAAAWNEGCGQYDIAKYPVTGDVCAYGPVDAAKTMFVVGDSHMTQWTTALIDIGRRAGWRVKLMVHDGCPFSSAPPEMSADTDPAHTVMPFAECPGQDRAKLAAILKEKPDLLVTAAMSPASYKTDLNWVWPSKQVLMDGYREFLGPVTEAGIPVAVIGETPRAIEHVPLCLQRNQDEPAACDTSRATAVGGNSDPLAEAVRGLPGAKVVDLTESICTPENCPAVVGNVVVYRDSHLTDTYTRTLARKLQEGLGLG
jgi:peptidoglycan/LPS O-acetylase OafA/YrhL